MKINLNKLAKDICAMEEGRVEVNIAQVKEVLRCAMDLIGFEFIKASAKSVGLPVVKLSRHKSQRKGKRK